MILAQRLRPLRVALACRLLYAAKAVAPVTLHAEGTPASDDRKVALLAIGSNVRDVGGLMVEATTRLVASLAGGGNEDDDLDEVIR